MKLYISFILLLTSITMMANQLENVTCQKCHPKIYEEYQHSMHRNASIFNDPVHKAVWDMHPLKKKNSYECAKCHTPSDHALFENNQTLTDNIIQRQEPISCQECHKIKSIEKHQKSNKNILTQKAKTFYTADTTRKGSVLKFQKESSFFGLSRKTIGSPYHDINYSNENFYNANVCMGCHSHKENDKQFIVCDMEVKKGDSKENCISCHMPKVKGTFVTLKDTKVHAYHGANILNTHPTMLAKHVELTFKKEKNGFTVTINNKANHTLFPHPLRLGELRVYITHNDKITRLKTQKFARVIGSKGKPTPPWLADQILKDTTIKAFEKRSFAYQTHLQKGDTVTARFGYHIVNPKMAKKLKITDDKLQEFIVFKKENFYIP